MGVMDVPSFAAGVAFKVPAYDCFFYTFNTLAFGLGRIRWRVGTSRRQSGLWTALVCVSVQRSKWGRGWSLAAGAARREPIPHAARDGQATCLPRAEVFS